MYVCVHVCMCVSATAVHPTHHDQGCKQGGSGPAGELGPKVGVEGGALGPQPRPPLRLQHIQYGGHGLQIGLLARGRLTNHITAYLMT